VIAGKRFDYEANKDVITYRCSFDLSPTSIPTWGEICDKVDSLMAEIEKDINRFSTPQKGVKTDKTVKTPIFFLLKRWFCQGFAKLSQPPSCCKVVMVVTGVSIPFSRRVLTVFPVLTYYLRERNKDK